MFHSTKTQHLGLQLLSGCFQARKHEMGSGAMAGSFFKFIYRMSSFIHSSKDTEILTGIGSGMAFLLRARLVEVPAA